MKIWVETLTSYSTFLTFFHRFVTMFILNEIAALHKLGQPIILWLEKYEFITEQIVIVHRVVIIYYLLPHIFLYPYGVFFKPITYPLFNSLGKLFIFRLKNILLLLDTYAVPNQLVYFKGTAWPLMHDYTWYFPACLLEVY